MSFTGQLDWSRTNGPVGSNPPDNLTATLLANARIGRVRVRGEARFNLSGQEADTRVAVIGEWSGKDDAEWRAELGYDRGLARGRAGLGYTRRFNKLQLSGFGEVATDGPFGRDHLDAERFNLRQQARLRLGERQRRRQTHSGVRQAPLLPPVFSSRRTPSITMPLSSALAMS